MRTPTTSGHRPAVDGPPCFETLLLSAGTIAAILLSSCGARPEWSLRGDSVLPAPHGTEGEFQMAANPSDKDMVIWALQCNHLESTLFALRYLADRGYQHSSLSSLNVESQVIDLADACIRLAAIAAAAEKCAADLRARPSGHTYGYFVGFRIASMSRSPVNMRAVVPSASCWTPNVSTLAQN